MITLRATATGTLFTAPIPTVRGDNPDTDAVETNFEVTPGVAGTQGLRDNPITRVDFYAAVAAIDGGAGTGFFKFIGSVPGSAAGAHDVTVNDNDVRQYIYEMEISKAAFLAIAGDDDGDFGAEDTAGSITAFAVKDNKGVAMATNGAALTVSEND